jgi:hypothetical protein
MKRAPTPGRGPNFQPGNMGHPDAGISRSDEPIWALLQKRADDLKAGRRRTPNEAASDLIVLGEILQMFESCDDISGAVVGWLGDQVAKAADEVLSALMGIPAAPAEKGQ